MNILLVEDEEGIRTSLALFLTEEGHSVVMASNGATAIEFIGNNNVDLDLVISDFGLPGANGLLVSAAADKRLLPFILMSSDPERKISGKAFLEKPFRFEKLQMMIREVMAK